MSDTRTAVYRFFNAEDALLYVGITTDPDKRQLQHRRSKAWWPEVNRRTVEWHPSREGAQMAEAEAIISESPLHNLVVPDPDSPWTWPAPNWEQVNAEASGRANKTRKEAARCPDCQAILPPPKICPGCGTEFYRGEGGRSDAECCSERCSARVRKRRQRQREAAA